METVQLTSEIKTTKLGFGCSNLFGGKSRKEGLSILQTTFESGIRHYDVAPIYGFGDAEKLLGDFLKGRRQQVTITTKFGVQAAGGPVAKNPIVVSTVRKVMGMSSHFKKLVQDTKERVISRSVFSVDRANKSLENSLRMLQTDRIDFLLLHDCTSADCEDSALLEFLKSSQAAGKIREFGVGTGFLETCEIHKHNPELTQAVQFESNVFCPNMQHELARTFRAVITHSPFSEPFGVISKYLQHDPEVEAKWCKEMDLDFTDKRNIAALCLKFAVSSNPMGVVLYSSQNKNRILRNAEYLADKSISQQQVAKFAEMVGEMPRL